MTVARRAATAMNRLRAARGDEWRILAAGLIAGLVAEVDALAWRVRLLTAWAALTAAPAAYGLWTILG